jgi:hypothetical protein
MPKANRITKSWKRPSREKKKVGGGGGGGVDLKVTRTSELEPQNSIICVDGTYSCTWQLGANKNYMEEEVQEKICHRSLSKHVHMIN